MQRTLSGDSLFSVTSDAPCNEIFRLGEQCRIDEKRVGTVAFVGTTSFAPGTWIGLVLEKPDGKNDGSVNGERYFQCAAKHGVFCRPSKLTKMYATGPMSPSLSNGPVSPTPSTAYSIASTTAATNKTRSIYARECGFDIGERVSIGGGKVGVLKFLDRIGSELYAGVQLDRPLGCCDGMFNNVRYFKCNPLYGIFVRASTVKKCAKIAKPATIEVRATKASTLRTWRGSQESLHSIGGLSMASVMSPQRVGAKASGSMTTAVSHMRDGEIVASLKTCLQEKEAHLDHLAKELEQRRAESEALAKNKLDATSQLDELKRMLDVVDSDRDAAVGKLQKMEQHCDDLTFQLDEAQVNRSVFEAENIDLRAQCSELRDKLAAALPAVVIHPKKMADANVQTDFVKPPARPKTSERGSDAFFSDIFSEIGSQTDPPPAFEKLVETHSVDTQTMNVHSTSAHEECQTSPSTSACTAIQTEDPQLMDSSLQTDVPVRKTAGTQTKQPEPLEHSTSQTDVVQIEVKPTAAAVETQTGQLESLVHSASQTNVILAETKPISTAIETQTESANRPKLADAFTQTILPKPQPTTSTQTMTSPTLAHTISQTDEVPAVVVMSAGIQAEPYLQHVLSQTIVVAMSEQSMQTAADEPAELVTRELQTDERVSHSSASQTTNAALVHVVAQTDALAAVSQIEVQTDISETPKKPVAKVSVHTSPLAKLYEHSAMQTMPVEVDTPKTDIVELNVSKLAVTSQSGRSNEIEAVLKEHKDKEEQLESTVSFLNSIISEQTATIGKLRSELSVRTNAERPATDVAPSPVKPAIVNEALPNNVIARRRVRLFCDNCEMFDQHDTDDCPKEVENRAESRSHVVTSPSAAVPIGRAAGGGKTAPLRRPFCDHCDAFVHETNECPSLVADPQRAPKKPIDW